MTLLLLFPSAGSGSSSITVDEIPAVRAVFVGDTVTIDATESGTSGDVDILLSKDNGATFPTTIASSVTLPYDWTPTSGQLADQAILRVRDSADALIVDDSLAFVIATTTAGSGGSVDVDEIAQAVWEYSQRGLTEAVELDSAAQGQLNRIEATTSGTLSGAGTGTEVFVGPNATVTVTVEADGDRTAVVVS